VNGPRRSLAPASPRRPRGAPASPRGPRRAPAWIVAAALLASAPARAQDGAYGRLDGDLAPGVEAGAAVPSGRGRVVPVAQGRLLYLGTAGIQGTWLGGGAGRPWSTSLGAELRPLFLARFLKNRESGPPRLDLLLDSLYLGLAARLGPEREPGLDLTLGLEIPLSRSFRGVYLGARLLRHWPHEAFALGQGRPETLALLTLGLRTTWTTHLADARDGVLR
jgi:hypothetical protein